MGGLIDRPKAAKPGDIIKPDLNGESRECDIRVCPSEAVFGREKPADEW